MGDVLTFAPRPKPAAPEILPPLAGAALRASLEEAARTALDAANRIIAVLGIPKPPHVAIARAILRHPGPIG